MRRAVPAARARRPRRQRVQLRRPSVHRARGRAETEAVLAAAHRRGAGLAGAAVRGLRQGGGSRTVRVAVAGLLRVQSGRERVDFRTAEGVRRGPEGRSGRQQRSPRLCGHGHDQSQGPVDHRRRGRGSGLPRFIAAWRTECQGPVCLE